MSIVITEQNFDEYLKQDLTFILIDFCAKIDNFDT